MKTGVYQIRNLVNGKRYIGSASVSFDKRWTAHLGHLRRGTHHSRYLQNTWTKHGEKIFEFEILEECSPDLCLVREQCYLDAEKPEYNTCMTVGSRHGVPHSKATKDKMSRKASGEGNPMYGKPIADEHRKNLSRARLGKKFSREHRIKIARSNGKLSESDVIKIRRDLDNGVSIRELYEHYGVTKSCIMFIKHRRSWRHI